MVIVKRLYRFMLRSFLPLLVMTFFICLFIVLMQFLWRYIDDLVGKGLEVHVIGELFFYAALSMVPMSLPLAILLASLMTFGNLGERFELTAMKASGVSLVKVMKPLIFLIAAIAVGAFFFQNNVLPIAQTKMWTLLYSVRQKSPELEIPEGLFYDQIPGYNFYVAKKDHSGRGTLYDMMIYDVSRGFDNARVILADSGHLKMADDKRHLFLQLAQGEQFENLRESESASSGAAQGAYRPYRRESFDTKDILLAFDANFNRMDEQGMRNQYVGKNISELQSTIDSVGQRVDSIGSAYATGLLRAYSADNVKPSAPTLAPRRYDMDSLFYKARPEMALAYVNGAVMASNREKQEYEFKSFAMEDDRYTIRRHSIEMHKKFTLSLACLIFFFIGAPLGAIIRKGGLGAPLVISVLLFIVYYIIDNSGYKLARDGKIEVWQGMWLSAAVLLPLGVFLTYKAVRDSAVFNIDAYRNHWRRLRGTLRRELEVKEFVMQEVEPAKALALLAHLSIALKALQESYTQLSILKKLYYLLRPLPARRQAQEALNNVVDYLADSRDKRVIGLVNLYPFQISLRNVGQGLRATDALIELFSKTQDNPTQLP